MIFTGRQRRSLFKLTAVTCAMMMGLLPMIEQACAEAIAGAAVDEAFGWTLSDSIAGVTFPSVRQWGTSRFEVTLASGASITIRALTATVNDDGAVYRAAVSATDEAGAPAMSSEELLVFRPAADPNVLSATGPIATPAGQGWRESPWSVDLTGRGLMKARAAIWVSNKGDVATYDADFSGLDAMADDPSALPGFGVTLGDSSSARRSDIVAAADPATEAIVGVAGAAVVAAILFIAIIGCLRGWWCMGTDCLAPLNYCSSGGVAKPMHIAQASRLEPFELLRAPRIGTLLRYTGLRA